MKIWYLLPLAFWGSLALGQEKSTFIPPSLAQSDRVKTNGWDRYLRLGLTGNLSDNSNVVGKTEGQTSTYGGKIEGALDYKEIKHEWLNSLNLLLSYSRAPQIPRTIKADDTLEIESLYKYYLSDFSGIFARANFDSSLTRGYDERDADTNYLIHKVNGDVQALTTDRLRLTQGLRPARIRESIGVFTNILDYSLLKMDLKGGLGLRQVIAARQRILNDDSSTPEVDVNELRNSNKAGYEIGTDIGGAMEDKRVTYKVSFNALFPFYETPDDDANGHTNFEKRVLDLTGKLSFHLTDWASLDYSYKMIRDPSIISKAQIAQTYLFSINQVLAERRAKPAAAPTAPAS